MFALPVLAEAGLAVAASVAPEATAAFVETAGGMAMRAAAKLAVPIAAYKVYKGYKEAKYLYNGGKKAVKAINDVKSKFVGSSKANNTAVTEFNQPKLPGHTYKEIIDNTYLNSTKDIREYRYNHELSTDKSKVWSNDSGHAIISHKGTDDKHDLLFGWKDKHDILTDAQYAVGYKGSRFKRSSKAQQAVERRFGPENVTTVGHSLGGAVAENVAHPKSKVVTYNKYAAPFSKAREQGQTDLRHHWDPASALDKGNSSMVNIRHLGNPLDAHSTKALDNVKTEY